MDICNTNPHRDFDRDVDPGEKLLGGDPMQLTINQDELREPVKEVAKELHLVPEESLKGTTWDINQFRKECCGGRSSDWVRTNVFDEFPETDYRNGGWCIAPHKTEGVKKTIIFAYEARMWMQEHFHEIDWLAK